MLWAGRRTTGGRGSIASQHANCGGACVRGGQAQWQLLLRVNRPRYLEWEAEEETSRVQLGKDVSILRDRAGGGTVPLTLTRFRERIERQPSLFDADDWGAYGCKVHAFISDDDVIAEAKAKDSTRAIEAMKKAHRLGLLDDAVVAIGNAPTALLETLRLVREEGAKPALVVGVPVGFVSAAESKEELVAARVPFIAARGRKGGSTIAVSILHALLHLAAHGEPS